MLTNIHNALLGTKKAQLANSKLKTKAKAQR
ncbi:hypothetical protein swp_4968 [Shewanella piezotolerans WP3]|uniref:Uncharacterized protein n=1 Tax=Shewanella piezotolerans (strain WP3 / JCM 13877) TaxID=225849 RepID=B8CVA9_SHEPW|nr:hypothetical protein swp_4968 [Shewanella piezotolerans WP3]